MFIKIPFESEIPFKTNISEISKMSLEHDFNVNEGCVLGNFYISGEYKAHDVSVNKDPFNYTLPFSVDLRDDLDRESLEFNIEDFSYEIVNDNTLKVNIEYSLNGELKEEELFEKVNEDELESELAYIDEFLEDNKTLEEVEEREIEEVDQIREEENIDDRISKEDEKTIMETIKMSDDTFVTYHIHVVKESESLESICALYNVPSSLVSEYNSTDTLSIGDKILIPEFDE